MAYRARCGRLNVTLVKISTGSKDLERLETLISDMVHHEFSSFFMIQYMMQATEHCILKTDFTLTCPIRPHDIIAIRL
jgi:hypothetical protein